MRACAAFESRGVGRGSGDCDGGPGSHDSACSGAMLAAIGLPFPPPIPPRSPIPHLSPPPQPPPPPTPHFRQLPHQHNAICRYEKARKLKSFIEDIRAEYTRNWDAKDVKERQVCETGQRCEGENSPCMTIAGTVSAPAK